MPASSLLPPPCNPWSEMCVTVTRGTRLPMKTWIRFGLDPCFEEELSVINPEGRIDGAIHAWWREVHHEVRTFNVQALAKRLSVAENRARFVSDDPEDVKGRDGLLASVLRATLVETGQRLNRFKKWGAVEFARQEIIVGLLLAAGLLPSGDDWSDALRLKAEINERVFDRLADAQEPPIAKLGDTVLLMRWILCKSEPSNKWVQYAHDEDMVRRRVRRLIRSSPRAAFYPWDFEAVLPRLIQQKSHAFQRQTVLRILPLLLKAGFNVEGQDSNGATAAHWAGSMGWLDMLKALKKKGVDLNQTGIVENEFGCQYEGTVLHQVCCFGEKEISDGSSPLIDALNWLRDNGADFSVLTEKGNSALHSACECENLTAVQWWIDQEWPIDMKNLAHHTPLDMVSDEAFETYFPFSSENEARLKAIKALLERKTLQANVSTMPRSVTVPSARL